VTQRSVLTTQSKLTVQAPNVGNGVPARLAILGSVGGSAHPCALPRMQVSLTRSLLGCLRKDVALVSRKSRVKVRRNQGLPQENTLNNIETPLKS
jgi:hypothetical protein